MRGMRRACSELPNDNPMLHDGAVWVSMSPTGRPRAVARPPVVVDAPEPAPQPAPVEIAVPQPVVTAAEPDAFAQLLALLGKVALGAGATRAAAVLADFVTGQVVDTARLGETLCAALVASGHAARSGSGVTVSAPVAATIQAWRAVLSGESDDLSGCDETLDTWCADLVAALAGTPSRAGEIRRELRRFGVAAFGLLAEAA